MSAETAPRSAEESLALFGPANPFYFPSSLPYHAPPFDRIQDEDYQPALVAGMAEQRIEITRIAENAAPPTFENTIVAQERTGQLLSRVSMVFRGVAGANTNSVLQAVQEFMAPRYAAHRDAMVLDAKLFARVAAVYAERARLEVDAESRHLIEVVYERFVQAGAELSEADKDRLKALNEEESTLRNAFTSRLLAANRDGALHVGEAARLAGLAEPQLAAAAAVARERGLDGYMLRLQNTTQQPLLAQLTDRATRRELFEHSWNRTERGGGNDTRELVSRLAQLRAEKGALLGASSYAAWSIADQMAKTPEAVLEFLDGLVAPAVAKMKREAADLQALMDVENATAEEGNPVLGPADWDFYTEQVRKARFDLDGADLKPYLEANCVLEDGVFYAAHLLYGLNFHERHDLPVYQADVRVFDVLDEAGAVLALFYCDLFKRDNKNGGAWMSQFVGQTKLLGMLPVVYNVCNFPKPVAGEAALLTPDDVITLFHEFGHALHGIFSDVLYPSLSGTSVARDFVEFPSQFNEHWADDPTVFSRYARHYQTGEPMPAELAAKMRLSARFNEGYRRVELLAAAQLDLQWHLLAAGGEREDPGAFERRALERTNLNLSEVPPRYRSSFFAHIWGGGYAAGYYAYLWSEVLDDTAFRWFAAHGGLTRANGDRLRRMILSRGFTEDLKTMYDRWLGGEDRGSPQE